MFQDERLTESFESVDLDVEAIVNKMQGILHRVSTVFGSDYFEQTKRIESREQCSATVLDSESQK